MLSYADIMTGRERYNEMLREAEKRRKMKGYEIEQPNIFERAFATLKRAFSAFTARRARRTTAQTSAMRQNLATE